MHGLLFYHIPELRHIYKGFNSNQQSVILFRKLVDDAFVKLAQRHIRAN
jgi:hypothetical protein